MKGCTFKPSIISKSDTKSKLGETTISTSKKGNKKFIAQEPEEFKYQPNLDENSLRIATEKRRSKHDRKAKEKTD